MPIKPDLISSELAAAVQVGSPLSKWIVLERGQGERLSPEEIRNDDSNGCVTKLQLPSDPAAILFTVSAPNRPGTVTELLIQPLKNVRCRLQAFYKSQGFVAFTAIHLTAAIPRPPGTYACPIQFLETTSGWTPLGKIEIS